MSGKRWSILGGAAILVTAAACLVVSLLPAGGMASSPYGKTIDAFLRAEVDPEYKVIQWYGPREIPALDEALIEAQEEAIAKVAGLLGVMEADGARFMREEHGTLNHLADAGVLTEDAVDESAQRDKALIKELSQTQREVDNGTRDGRQWISELRAMRPIHFSRLKYSCVTNKGGAETRDRIFWVYDGKVYGVQESVRGRFLGHFDK